MSDPVDYKSTIRLMKTAFPMRASLAQREPETLAKWEAEHVYEAMLEARKDAPAFVFHDGPPYANGELHYGHVLNKTLKDIAVKYQALAGRRTSFVPGWDCHGLPIEHGVEVRAKKAGQPLDRLALRAACAEEANKWIDVQRTQFKRLGVFATWDHPYLTMDHRFEKGILEALASFARHGLLYRGRKPVYWSWAARTALAEAEIEYAPHVSPSIYVKFPVVGAQADALAKKLGVVTSKPLFAVIWTTTPWTLPANLAIAVHPEFLYEAVDVEGERWVLARELTSKVLSACKKSGEVVGVPTAGAQLVGISARHPFEDRDSPILSADYVTLEAGTGLVHTAPGHGPDDYVLGQAHGLEVLSPVDDQGCFTSEVREAWRGLQVFKANPLIEQLLADTGRLANPIGARFEHSYPHCWRTKTPVIFRATTQWFIALDEPMAGRVDRQTLRQLALAEVDAMAEGRDTQGTSGWVPAWGRDRIHGMLRDRPDWTISRQRAWGVPIPAFHCTACEDVVLDEETILHVSRIFDRDGADAWFTREAAELAPPGLQCRKCGGTSFTKDASILDVWFESGASFWAVMGGDAYGDREALPVDLYLEGSDQHRGWFHSSLLVGCSMIGRAPYKRVVTHGFLCDEQGRPYSKSDIRRRQEAGEKVEYVDPQKLIAEGGAEILRLWTAYEDYRSDVRFSRAHLKQVSEAYLKIRNTLRFMLGNLGDARVTEEVELDALDAWARARLHKYLRDVVTAYEEYDFRAVYHRTIEIASLDWSSFYLDVLKDRLYCDGEDSLRRRSSLKVLREIVEGTLAALAPILSFTADEAWRHLPGEGERSVFVAARLQAPPPSADEDALLAAGEVFFAVREKVNAAYEPKVKAQELGHRREAQVTITLPAAMAEQLSQMTSDLSEALAVSHVEVLHGDALSVTVIKSEASQCPRCWRFLRDVGTNASHPTLCARCAHVMSEREGA